MGGKQIFSDKQAAGNFRCIHPLAFAKMHFLIYTGESRWHIPGGSSHNIAVFDATKLISDRRPANVKMLMSHDYFSHATQYCACSTRQSRRMDKP